MIRRVVAAAVLALLVVGIACNKDETRQRTVSRDGRFAAEVILDRGGPVAGGNMSYVTLESELTPTKHREDVCSLSGDGELSISWTGPSTLTVTCAGCDPSRFHVYFRSWQGASIAYLQ
jgi:hypothetical protein